jgi:transcriptional regulator GlxA family with amidase domain
MRKMAVFQPHLAVTGKTKAKLEQHLETLETEFTEKEPGYQLVVKTRMIECMVTLSRYAQRTSSKDAREEHMTDEQWLLSIVAMLKQNFDKPFTLEQLSRLCGMSVSSFSAKFKAYTGKTLMEFKHELQIREACRLLEETDEKILTIALKAGFSEAAFFHRVFRRRTGMSPALYRANFRKRS